MIRCTAFLWEAELQKDLMESSWPSWPSRWAPLPPYSSSGLQDGLTGSWNCNLCRTALMAVSGFPNNSSSEVQGVQVCLSMLDRL